MSIPKEHLLAKLYYELGKQSTDFALQHSHKEGEETIWTKRHTFLELTPERDQWFIQHCNHRQILKNEIIIDFDRTIDRENALEDRDIKKMIEWMEHDKWRFCIYHTGSKGVHIHIYNNWLIPLSKEKREEFRMKFLKTCQKKWFANIDFQKGSDKTMIALEHTPHWKTGIEKKLIYQYNPEDQVSLWIKN